MLKNFNHVAFGAAALLLASASTTAMASSGDVIIVTNSTGPNVSASNGLKERLEAAGYSVTIQQDAANINGSSPIAQVWDVRYDAALSGGEQTDYLTYLSNAGGLFLLGENPGQALRNNSISSFISAAGGGNVTVDATDVTNQYVTDLFNGSGLIVADAATEFFVPWAGAFTSPGTGTFFTTAGPNGTGFGTGLAFGAGSLANAPAGRLLSYLDVNTFQAAAWTDTPALRSLVDRMIGFVAGDFQIDPNLPPVGGTPVIDDSQPSFTLGDSAATGSTISFDGGTLDLTGGSDPANLVTADVSITDNGAFVNTAGNSGTFAGTITGVGGLIVSGQGSLALTGTNTFEGGTVITDSSTVEIASADALGTGGVVLMQGRLRFGADGTVNVPVTLMAGLNALDTGANDVSMGGEIAGSGSFVKTGSGTLVLTGANSYTGGTTIAAGTLQASSTTIGTGNVLNAGTLVMDQSVDGSFGGAVSGTGSFVKTGEGKLNLTGTSSYSGATIVEEGRLAVNGSIANSGVIVESGGSIGGNGTVGGLIVRTNAKAAPGNSIGQLQAATTVLFEQGSVFEVEVDASGASDRVVASGVATLQGGTVQVLAANGDYRPQTSYQILTAAGGVVGEFEDVTSNLAFLLPNLTYGANAVTLTLTRNDVQFADVAVTANQRATAVALGTSFSAATPVYLELVGESAQGAQAAFDSLSGEVHASTLTVVAQQADEMRRALLSRMAAPAGEGLTLWTDVHRSWNQLDGNRNVADVSSDAYGFQVGLETQMGALRIGVAGGYANGDTSIGARQSQADTETVSGAIYAGGDVGRLALRAGASYSDYDFKTRRTAVVGDIAQTLTANYGGRAIQAFGEAGTAVPLGIGTVEPFVGVNAIWLKNDAFTEAGGSLALTGEEKERRRAWATLGLKASVPLNVGSPVSIGAKLGWQHALTGRSVTSDLAFVAGGADFRIEGVPLARNAALVDAGIRWSATRNLSLGVTYTGSIADQGQSHAARAVLAASF
ncbi:MULTISPECIES: autotransporter domain-containing protein [unclassified Sphingobium]|uniref:autotransporter outer membrane beta-barrel domain-containing protein n=1 Tax=unclassified Sphingobium TaxID=2611147 RepID=UPI002224FC19|nr:MULTISPECIES: autotransporter domain-containing protein [unclassified Sphingobium]MCW2411666.1 autotransporter-associated beta strand protein [Sphingobium sp. B8D3D]MCW2416041.1 autotransporter-associated beta strand protein [Sphingobium sp. B8D3A]